MVMVMVRWLSVLLVVLGIRIGRGDGDVVAYQSSSVPSKGSTAVASAMEKPRKS